jgi:hypothetical protein
MVRIVVAVAGAVVALGCGGGAVGESPTTSNADDGGSTMGPGLGTDGCDGAGSSTTGPPPVVGPELTFVDITASSPDLVAHPHGSGTGWGGVDMYSPGIALVDLDGDGELDLVQPRNHRSDPTQRDMTLFRGLGDGTFEHAVDLPWSSSWNPVGVVAFDYDGDDDLDVFVAADGGSSRLFRNAGAWQWEDATVEAGVGLGAMRAYTAAAADVDGDEDLDLYVGAWNEGTDFEGSAPNVLLINQGDGTFVDGTAAAGVDCNGWSTLGQAFADLDADGDQDLYVANDFFPDCLYENQGDGTFVDVAGSAGIGFAAKHGMGVAIGDMDGDGWLDIFVTDDGGEDDTLGNAVYFNRGDGTLSYTERALELGLDGIASSSLMWNVCWGVGLVDLDLDTDLDVHVATHNDRPELWWQRDDQGAYHQDIALQEPGSDARGSAYGDLDRDGDIDVVLGRRNDPIGVLRNDTVGGNSVTVVPRPLAAAVGAQVQVTMGEVRQTVIVAAGSGYLSTNPYEAVVGLGDATVADHVEVRFADGTVRTFDDVAASERLVVVRDP